MKFYWPSPHCTGRDEDPTIQWEVHVTRRDFCEYTTTVLLHCTVCFPTSVSKMDKNLIISLPPSPCVSHYVDFLLCDISLGILNWLKSKHWKQLIWAKIVCFGSICFQSYFGSKYFGKQIIKRSRLIMQKTPLVEWQWKNTFWLPYSESYFVMSKKKLPFPCKQYIYYTLLSGTCW